MAARLLDGNDAGARIRAELAPRIARFTEQAGRPPGLGIVLAGADPASEIYVGSKLKSAGDVGCRTDLLRVAADAPLEAVLGAVRGLNESDEYDGILVQNRHTLAPCTPSGIIELLRRSNIPMAGARAVVIGRSDIVGKPMALLLLHQNATVTVCHSKTRDLPAVVRDADIVVAAIGRAGFVQPDWIKPGATVVDVGINRVTDAAEIDRLLPADSPRRAVFAKRGALVVGDVHPGVAETAGALTPVPGGVGPLTIAMLLHNTVAAAERRVRTPRPAARV
jgi:methylenetetrahydrofolate dehydrogenase (NADP+)/methenyltetrahydrofolate cyclohydrolase